jgi:hypothetical protein
MNTIENLTSEALNAKARTLADEVRDREIALFGRTVVAYAAAIKGCANARDVEVLENLLAITSPRSSGETGAKSTLKGV